MTPRGWCGAASGGGGSGGGRAVAGRSRRAISNAAATGTVAREIEKKFERVSSARRGRASELEGKPSAWVVLGIAANNDARGENGTRTHATGETRHDG